MSNKNNDVVKNPVTASESALVQALSDYTAERMTELLVIEGLRSSTRQRHRAILHRQEAEETAKKAGVPLDDLKDASDVARQIAASKEHGGSEYMVFFENCGLQVYKNGVRDRKYCVDTMDMLYFMNYIAKLQGDGAAIRFYPYASEYYVKGEINP